MTTPTLHTSAPVSALDATVAPRGPRPEARGPRAWAARAAALLVNPVVVRDLRAQMRGTKSYWFMGAYLLLLGLLSIAGYAQAVGTVEGPDGRPVVSMVDAQWRLQQVNGFIFGTMATLVCLISPALTAASVVGERQRQSLDLLLTTPLSAAEMLIGKLVSSVAFLGMLLALALPASALCVVLGGATLADILRTYLLLGAGGLVLSAIGLYFSCACRTPLLAVLWSYGAVGVAVAVTLPVVALGAASTGEGQAVVYPLLWLGALNPFVATLAGSMGAGEFFANAPLGIPVWLGALGVAALLVRLLVTAAAYRLGAHGGGVATSLRRQTLLATGLLLLGIGQTCGSMWTADNRPDAAEIMGCVLCVLAGTFVLAAPMLPGLFVPAAREDGPPGGAEDAVPADADAPYRLRSALQPWHAGALPFYHLWLLIVGGALLAGLALGARTHLPVGTLAASLGVSLWYVAGLGTLLWSISRWAATLTRGASGARGLAFGIALLVMVGPALVLSLGGHPWHEYGSARLWLGWPFMMLDSGPYPTSKDGQVDPALQFVGTSTAALLVGGLALAYAGAFELLRAAGLKRRARKEPFTP